MTTSLHDQFHSTTNTNHIFNLLDNMIHSKTNKSIKNEDYYSNYFQNSLKEIFINSSNCNLEDLNREVLHYNQNHIYSSIKKYYYIIVVIIMYHQNNHRTIATTPQRKKQLIALTLFLFSFLFASYYAPEHIDGYTTPPTQAK